MNVYVLCYIMEIWKVPALLISTNYGWLVICRTDELWFDGSTCLVAGKLAWIRDILCFWWTLLLCLLSFRLFMNFSSLMESSLFSASQFASVDICCWCSWVPLRWSWRRTNGAVIIFYICKNSNNNNNSVNNNNHNDSIKNISHRRSKPLCTVVQYAK